MSFLGVNIAATESVAGRAAVYLGKVAASGDFDGIDSNFQPVGALDGTVSISPNQDIVKLQRSDGQNPYAVLETAYDFQVTFSVQEVDVFNLSMALSYEVTPSADNITSGYAILRDNEGSAASASAALKQDNSGAIVTRALQLGSDNQSPYRSMLIRVEGGTYGGSRSVAEWQFYKVKIQATGSIDYDRTGAVTYPVTAHCLGNDNDVVGQFITPSTFERTNNYGE